MLNKDEMINDVRYTDVRFAESIIYLNAYTLPTF